MAFASWIPPGTRGFAAAGPCRAAKPFFASSLHDDLIPYRRTTAPAETESPGQRLFESTVFEHDCKHRIDVRVERHRRDWQDT